MELKNAVLGQEVVVSRYGVGRITEIIRYRPGQVDSIGVTPYAPAHLHQMNFSPSNVEPWPIQAATQEVLPLQAQTFTGSDYDWPVDDKIHSALSTRQCPQCFNDFMGIRARPHCWKCEQTKTVPVAKTSGVPNTFVFTQEQKVKAFNFMRKWILEGASNNLFPLDIMMKAQSRDDAEFIWDEWMKKQIEELN